ncbi:MAG TPA: Maf family protein [Xanthobacteraceae bacterium]
MGLWLADAPLILASRSASRRAVLEGAAIAVEVLPADVDERAIEAGASDQTPGAIARILARAKALSVAAQRPGRLVLGADQTLALGARLFAKPADLAAAWAQLKVLRGATHELHSALALVRDGAVLFEHCETAALTMRDFSDRFLSSYIEAAGSAVTASVGGYQVEGAGIQLFEQIAGDHFTILGLPLLPLLTYLRAEGHLAK